LNCLILNPVKPLDLTQYKHSIIKALSELNIIGNSIIKDNNDYFFAGEHYLQYISFLGCSPYLNFEPKTDIALSDLQDTLPDLNYVQFNFNSTHYSFNKTEFGVKAICPVCKSKIIQWQGLIDTWEKDNKPKLPCPQCKQTISILDINWRKTAGFYLSAILFYGIQSELAVPADNFLTRLEDITNSKWRYFFG